VKCCVKVGVRGTRERLLSERLCRTVSRRVWACPEDAQSGNKWRKKMKEATG